MKWRHQQELAEVKANIDNMIKDLKNNITKESQRTIEEFKARLLLDQAELCFL